MSVHQEYMIIFNVIILAGLLASAIVFAIYNSGRYVEVFYDKPARDKKTLLRHYKIWFRVSCIMSLIFLILFAYQIHELRLLRIL